jgi:hypothetical protein
VAARPAWPARSPASEPLVEEAWARYVMGGRALYDAGASVGFFAEMLRRRWRLLRPGETVVISFLRLLDELQGVHRPESHVWRRHLPPHMRTHFVAGEVIETMTNLALALPRSTAAPSSLWRS